MVATDTESVLYTAQYSLYLGSLVAFENTTSTFYMYVLVSSQLCYVVEIVSGVLPGSICMQCNRLYNIDSQAQATQSYSTAGRNLTILIVTDPGAITDLYWSRVSPAVGRLGSCASMGKGSCRPSEDGTSFFFDALAHAPEIRSWSSPIHEQAGQNSRDSWWKGGAVSSAVGDLASMTRNPTRLHLP